MKLIYVPGACSLGPHIALRWAGAVFELERAAFGDQRLFDLNPIGTVAILELSDGPVLVQTPAILWYIARRFPEAGLGGDGSVLQKAQIDTWLSFLVSDLHHTFYMLFDPAKYGIEGNESARAKIRALCNRNLAALDAALEGRAHLLPTGRSILDAYLFPMVRWSYAHFEGPERRHSNLNRFYRAMCADPEVQTACHAEDIDI